MLGRWRAHEILEAGARELERCGLHRGGFTTLGGDGDSPVCGMGAMRRAAFGAASVLPRPSFGLNVDAYDRAEGALAKVMAEQLGVPVVYTTPIRYCVGSMKEGTFWNRVGEPKTAFDIIKDGNDEYAVGTEDMVACMEKAAVGLR